jgi:hypothetical protein
MIGDHTSVNGQALALLKKLNVKPEDNPTSQSLTQAADAERKACQPSARAIQRPLEFCQKTNTRCPAIGLCRLRLAARCLAVSSGSAFAADDAEKGKQVVKKCGMCHQIGPDAKSL